MAATPRNVVFREVTNGNGSSISIGPTIYVAGDLLFLVARSDSAIINTVTGYTLLVDNSAGSADNLSVWYKFASASESAQTVTTNNAAGYAHLLVFGNVSSAAPDTSSTGTSTAVSMVTTSLTTTQDYDLLINIWCVNAAQNDFIVGGSCALDNNTLVTQNVGSRTDSMCTAIYYENGVLTGATTPRTLAAGPSGVADSNLYETYSVAFKRA